MKINSYKNKKGETLYGFRIFLGYDPVTGKKYETKRQGFKTRAEAKNSASELQIKFDQGKLNKNSHGIKTFQELFNLWFESYKNTVKRSTVTDTLLVYQNYIEPKFKNIKINVTFCQKCVNYWHARYESYRRIKNLAAQIIDYAITLELIDSNPMRKIILPKPKTKTSVSTLDIDLKTSKILQAWRSDQQHRFIKIGINTLNNDQYVFTQDKTNKLLAPSRANDWLRWIYKHYPKQRKITIHGFRHTHASLLFEAGATIKQVQDRLGHSNSKTTLDIYTHVTKKAKHDTAEKFADFMEK
ncbi:hypothetical protein FC89_GL002144 [Liquorilactobacillus ghanensis DSM 18630]|uniref:Tyr recombinase domain-containing protein n=2 Tax=Liquorilactobacillus ghanensis TaxID=399370 RepID=A0A0R1VGT0_9LACO|nr:tyrosine-type recombinase/integrase [Liquorilactobacillus ghanensis]KRM04463.1 hypothetical protein FC89_GL002144 [Liquorilactobacillus ghanensis DSM 18630]